MKVVANVEGGKLKLTITMLLTLFRDKFNLITIEDLENIRFLVLVWTRSNNNEG